MINTHKNSFEVQKVGKFYVQICPIFAGPVTFYV